MFALCKLLWIIHILIADKERSKQQFSITYLITILLKFITYLVKSTIYHGAKIKDKNGQKPIRLTFTQQGTFWNYATKVRS